MIASKSKYKETGLKWITEIPEHWELKRLGGLFEERNETVSENDYAPLSVTMKGIVPQLESAAKTMHVDNRKKVCVGDFAINSRSDRRGSGGLSNLEGSVSIVNTVLKPSKFYVPEYTHYLLTNKLFQDEYYAKGKGIVADMWSTRFSEMKTIYLPVPPKAEQDEIVQYIKAQEEKINLFIQKKEHFIELLREQRLSIINDMLQINAKKIRLKFCVTKVGSGVTPRGGAEVYQDEGVIFLRSQNVHNDGLRLENVSYISEEINSEMKGSEVQFNDVLINVTGASIGRCFVYDIDAPANVNQHVCIMRPIQEVINSEFLMLQLQSEKIQTIINMVEGASREGLTNEDIKNFPLFVPTLEEQKQIVAHIKTETATIDTAIAKAEREIELIREYKEAMIAEAVMGKRGINNN